uniref:Transmembrane protein 254 n=1 Tax=Cyprinus carpio TaxID=7962 RepID=A0A8C2JJ45_CYPCA
RVSEHCNCGSAVIVFSLFQWTVFWPQDVPYGLLGPLGALAKYFVDYHYPVMYYGWFMTWVIHLFEALFALKLCSCLNAARSVQISLLILQMSWTDQTQDCVDQ